MLSILFLIVLTVGLVGREKLATLYMKVARAIVRYNYECVKNGNEHEKINIYDIGVYSNVDCFLPYRWTIDHQFPQSLILKIEPYMYEVEYGED